MLARARAAGVIAVRNHDIRAHGTGKHRQVDDTPYGGGSGMVLKGRRAGPRDRRGAGPREPRGAPRSGRRALPASRRGTALQANPPRARLRPLRRHRCPGAASTSWTRRSASGTSSSRGGNRGARPRRCGGAARPRGARKPRKPRPRVVPGRSPGGAPVHAAGRLPGLVRPRSPPIRAPREGRGLAERAIPGPHSGRFAPDLLPDE